jgi:hypothetical protein
VLASVAAALRASAGGWVGRRRRPTSAARKPLTARRRHRAVHPAPKAPSRTRRCIQANGASAGGAFRTKGIVANATVHPGQRWSESAVHPHQSTLASAITEHHSRTVHPHPSTVPSTTVHPHHDPVAHAIVHPRDPRSTREIRAPAALRNDPPLRPLHNAAQTESCQFMDDDLEVTWTCMMRRDTCKDFASAWVRTNKLGHVHQPIGLTTSICPRTRVHQFRADGWVPAHPSVCASEVCMRRGCAGPHAHP